MKFTITNHIRIVFGIGLCTLLWCPNIYGKTIISEGSAFIGSGITLEEAKLIALNDARQKALNSLGVFVESEAQVVDYRLTKDEIKTITGAIMTSEVLESSKEIVQDVFVLKIKAKFDISESSLQQALRNYQDRSKDQKTIKHLIKTIDRLQKELIKETKGSPETIEIVDEIDFSTKRLGKLLTTKEVISYELQMQELYKKKIENHFKSDVFPKLCGEIAKLLVWEKIPELSYNKKLRLNFVGYEEAVKGGDKQIRKQFEKYLNSLEPIATEYDQLNLKVHPEFHYSVKFKVPVHVYINQKKINEYYYVRLQRHLSRWAILETILEIDPESGYSPPALRDYSVSILKIRRYHLSLPSSLSSWDIELPDKYRLSDIENIEVRLGRVDPRDIQFSFFE